MSLSIPTQTHLHALGCELQGVCLCLSVCLCVCVSCAVLSMDEAGMNWHLEERSLPPGLYESNSPAQNRPALLYVSQSTEPAGPADLISNCHSLRYSIDPHSYVILTQHVTNEQNLSYCETVCGTVVLCAIQTAENQVKYNSVQSQLAPLLSVHTIDLFNMFNMLWWFSYDGYVLCLQKARLGQRRLALLQYFHLNSPPPH